MKYRIIDSEEHLENKFYLRIKDNKHFIELYSYIMQYFLQKYPEVFVTDHKDYVGIKLGGGLNRCWFTTSRFESFIFKFRKDINEKALDDNVITYNILNINDFKTIIPAIQEKMSEEQISFNEKKQSPINSSLNLNDVLEDDSDVVKVFSTGSCNAGTRLGKYHALLEYKSHYKAINGDLEDTTANRCIITGLIEAVKLLKKPCKVFLVTSTPIGIASVRGNGKSGINADILKILLEILDKKQCEPKFIAVEGEGEKLNRHILHMSLKTT